MNFEEKKAYLSARGWNYSQDYQAGKHWRCPHDGTFYGIHDATSTQKKIDSGEFVAIICKTCQFKFILKTRLDAHNLCSRCRHKERYKKRGFMVGEEMGASVKIPARLTDRLKALGEEKNLPFQRIVSDLLDFALEAQS